MVHEFPIRLPRHAFSARDAARAADLWRACQEVATDASTAVGWPPGRYREQGIGFVVREMTMVHHRETSHGEPLSARTWVREFRRGIVTTREVRLHGPHGAVASATQTWVHVRAKPEARHLEVARAGAEVVAAFAAADLEPSPALEPYQPAPGPWHEVAFEAWHTWMDPLGHANHPAYVDWCDEAVCRLAHRASIDPLQIRPVGETVLYKSGVFAPARVVVRTRLAGRSERDVVFAHEILCRADAGESTLAATATTHRTLVDGNASALADAAV